MAVKERKQITGTTAQINAYEGHEGQIVWDKEKKTFVGMSGTAGENYPLAPKAYVDNEISKVNTEVAKKQPKGDYATNAQVTEGLEGKEDKGVCLPLTGGVINGSLTIKDAFRLYANTDEKIGTITSEPIGGAYLDIFRKDAPSYAGCFSLGARLWDPGTSTPSKTSILTGTPDGTLTWAGSEVVRIGRKRVQDFAIGATATRYTAPFTGKCIVAGPPKSGSCNVELINEATNDQMSASCSVGNGWLRGWVLVRKGDPVNIIYYNWDPKEARWVEF